MTTPSLKDLQQVNQQLSRKAHRFHRELILHVLESVQHYDRFTPLRDLMRVISYENAEDVEKVLDVVDSYAETVYFSAAEHFAANQIVALLKKYPFPVSGIESRAEKVAWTKFIAAEQKCSVTNAMFKHIDRRSEMMPQYVPSEDSLSRMRAFIKFILGDTHNYSWIEHCDFGPGANVGVSGNATNKKRKLLSRWSVSPSAYDYARIAVRSHLQIHELIVDSEDAVSSDYLSIFDAKFRSRCDIVEYNKVVFVPKTTRVKRPIAVEPLLNSYLQKGIDLQMRDLLKRRANVDLSDQESNCRMAWEGSFDEEDGFCTIDLSSASDSIATEVVRNLLPPDWFYLLDRIRSKSFKINGALYEYNKFCSMGNGFCFPLQTLIFLAACHATRCGMPGVDYRVYGDDIIVRKAHFKPVIELLAQLGFSVNADKTFGSGPFRESCGSDFYSGVDVRPVYLDYPLASVGEIIKFHNATLRSINCDVFFASTRELLFTRVPSRLRLVAPDSSEVTDAAFRVERSSPRFLASPFTRYSKKTWSMCWLEFVSSSWEDRSNYGSTEREVGIAYLYGALSGAPARKTFTVRRKTITNVRRKTGAGATSLWLPPIAL
jgi:hypothetical protein